MLLEQEVAVHASRVNASNSHVTDRFGRITRDEVDEVDEERRKLRKPGGNVNLN
jgi:hypothetical protein